MLRLGHLYFIFLLCDTVTCWGACLSAYLCNSREHKDLDLSQYSEQEQG
jgi:hypothetical protein